MSIQDDVDVLGFEIVRRAILFTSGTLLADETSRLGYNGDPNLAGTSTDGEALLYNSPIGTLYIQDDGTMWRKSVNTPETKTWVLMGEGSSGDDSDLIELTSTVQTNSGGWGMHTDVSELTNTVQTNSAAWGAGGGGGPSGTLHVINRGSFDLNMYSCPGEPHFLSMQENNFAADTVWEDLTYHHTLLLPYDACVKRVVIRGSATHGATIQVGMHTNRDVTDTNTEDYKYFPRVATETQTNTFTNNNESIVYTFTSEASARVGDTLGLSLSSDRPAGSLNATIVLDYKTNDQSYNDGDGTGDDNDDDQPSGYSLDDEFNIDATPVLHLDANMINGSNEYGNPVDGGAVMSWQDRSGNNRNFTESTNQPIYRTNTLLGNAGVEFDGVNDMLNDATIFNDTDFSASQATMIAVVIPGSVNGNWSDSTTGSSHHIITTGKDDNARDDNTNGKEISGYFLENGVLIETDISKLNPTSRPYIKSVTVGTDYVVYANGRDRFNRSLESLQTTFGLNTNGCTLGGGNTDAAYQGMICEVLMFNTVLSEQQLYNVHQYLSKKYGINVYVPSTPQVYALTQTQQISMQPLLHFDSSEIDSVLDSSYTQVTDGGDVTFWRDKTNGHVATQQNQERQPSYVSERTVGGTSIKAPAIYFDGTEDFEIWSEYLLGDYSHGNKTGIFIFEPDGDDQWEIYGHGSTSSRMIVNGNKTYTATLRNTRLSGTPWLTGPQSNNLQILEIYSDAEQNTYDVESLGQKQIVTQPTSWSNSQNSRRVSGIGFGGYSPGGSAINNQYNLKGWIYEIMIFDDIVTETDKNTLVNYTRTKYGLNTTSGTIKLEPTVALTQSIESNKPLGLDIHAMSIWFRPDLLGHMNLFSGFKLKTRPDSLNGASVRCNGDAGISWSDGTHTSTHTKYTISSNLQRHLSVNSWHHLLLNYVPSGYKSLDGTASSNGEGYEVWLDGNRIDLTTDPDRSYGLLATSSNFCVGREDNRENIYGYSGSVANPAIFGASLTHDQIKSMYNNGCPVSLAEYSPSLWWRTDQIVDGKVLNDPSATSYDSGNDGNLKAWAALENNDTEITDSDQLPKLVNDFHNCDYLNLIRQPNMHSVQFGPGAQMKTGDISDTVLSDTTGITISMWLNLTSTGNEQTLIQSDGYGVSGSTGFRIYLMTTDHLRIDYFDGETVTTGSHAHNYAANLGKWTHVSFRFQSMPNSGGREILVYINGGYSGRVNNTEWNQGADWTAQHLLIGDPANPLSGKIDDLRVYDRDIFRDTRVTGGDTTFYLISRERLHPDPLHTSAAHAWLMKPISTVDQGDEVDIVVDVVGGAHATYTNGLVWSTDSARDSGTTPELWLDASDPNSVIKHDSSDTIVTALLDRSGNDNHAENPPDDATPSAMRLASIAYNNNYNMLAIAADGAPGFRSKFGLLFNNLTFPAGQEKITMVYVYYLTQDDITSNTGNFGVFGQHDTSGNDTMDQHTNDNTYMGHYRNNRPGHKRQGQGDLWGVHMCTVQVDAAANSYKVSWDGGRVVYDSADETNTNFTTWSFSNNVNHIGGAANANMLTASEDDLNKFGEAIFLKDADDNKTAQIEGYLAHKWGIHGRLPSAHAFKNHKPNWTDY